MATTRAEHLAWCQQRALAYLEQSPPDLQGAITSMLSDLSKHAETAEHAGRQLAVILLMGGYFTDADAVRRFIDGFN